MHFQNQNIIKLLASISWTQNQWDLSFEEVIDLNKILPCIDAKYESYLKDNESQDVKSGKHYILWLPPHSELNGLSLRPKEILKAHIMEADVFIEEWKLGEYKSLNRRKCEIYVKGIVRLLDVPVINSRLEFDLKFDDDYYRIQYYRWDHYVMVFKDAEYVQEEFLFSIQNGEVILLFMNGWVAESYESFVCHQLLSGIQRTAFFNLLNRPPLIPEAHLELRSDQVQGASYY